MLSKVLTLGLSLSLFLSTSPVLGQTLETKSQPASTGVIVKLSSSTSLDNFLKNNGLNYQQVKVSRNGYVLIEKNNLPTTSRLKNYSAADFQKITGVDQSEDNGSYQLFATIPNDYQYSREQWNMQNIGMETAWDETTGSNNVVVAVIDTGLKMGHEDLANQVWSNTGEIPDNGLDDDLNGYADDVHGYDFVNNSNNPADDYGHGSAVASIVGAEGNNGVGMAGINWQTSIMPLKVCDAGGWCTWWSVAEAIYYAADNGAKVINLSLGGYYDSFYMRNAIEYAANKGVTIVAASGNEYGQEISYPARYSQVIAVGAVDKNDVKADFSNAGPELALVAPGVSVYTAYADNDTSYQTWSGTSFAAPHVAGAAALLLSYKADLSSNQIKNYLYSSAHQVAGMAGQTWTAEYGFGRLDVSAAISQIRREQGLSTIEGRHESESLYHQIGQVVYDSSFSGGRAVQAVTSDGSGFLQYGPYVGDQISGNTYLVKFGLATPDISNSNIIARVETVNTANPSEWYYLDIRGTDFNAASMVENFFLKIQKNSTGSLEYRVYTYGLCDLTVDYTEVSLLQKDPAMTYQSENLYHQVGHVIYDSTASESMATMFDGRDRGFAQFGPYASDLTTSSHYRANFVAAISDNSINQEVIRLEVNNLTHPALSVARDIKSTDFATTNNYEKFGLDFQVENNDRLEYRVYSYGNHDDLFFKLDGVAIDSNSNFALKTYEAEDLPSQTGSIIAGDYYSGSKARQAVAGIDSAGFMVYGPYSTELANQNYYAVFRLKTSDNQVTAPVATIEITNPGGTATYVQKNLTGTMFATNDTWQNFTLHFNRGVGGVMEYRVYFHDQADIAVDDIQIINKTSDYIVYQAEDLNQGIGTIKADSYNQEIYVETTPTDGAGYIIYGPYTTDQVPGDYAVTFRIKNQGEATGTLARVEVVNNGGSSGYVWQELTSDDFYSHDYSYVTLYYHRVAGGNLEFRVYTTGQTTLDVDSITVQRVG